MEQDNKKYKIIKNMAKCLCCGDVVESTHRHDFKTCKCGKLSVDGGVAYLKRSFEKFEEWQELSEEEEDLS